MTLTTVIIYLTCIYLLEFIATLIVVYFDPSVLENLSGLPGIIVFGLFIVPILAPIVVSLAVIFGPFILLILLAENKGRKRLERKTLEETTVKQIELPDASYRKAPICEYCNR